MNTLKQKALRFLKSEDGPTAVEYAVMLALIVVVCIAAITSLGVTEPMNRVIREAEYVYAP